MNNKIFLDALSKSDARWDGKQESFFIWPCRNKICLKIDMRNELWGGLENIAKLTRYSTVMLK